jgi:hypothetical protein
MCKDCGCSITDHHHEEHHHHHHHEHENDKKVVEVIQNILDKNDKQAISNRKHFERAWGILHKPDEFTGFW